MIPFARYSKFCVCRSFWHETYKINAEVENNYDAGRALWILSDFHALYLINSDSGEIQNLCSETSYSDVEHTEI